MSCLELFGRPRYQQSKECTHESSRFYELARFRFGSRSRPLQLLPTRIARLEKAQSHIRCRPVEDASPYTTRNSPRTLRSTNRLAQAKYGEPCSACEGRSTTEKYP